ncbi:uncharacterized protein [Porites lutea]|uniref:uncharacterized protein n=1 Tax=Porites lutea TaxID=51062 RepID=UPI003CC6B385
MTITRKYMVDMKKVKNLNLARNNIAYLEKGLFSDLKDLEVLDLSGNEISFITEGILNGLPKLSTLYLHENKISSLESGSFRELPGLKHLWLFINRIWDLPYDVFHGLAQLKVLSLSMNKLTQLNDHLLRDTNSLEYMFFQHNEIKLIPDYFFRNATSLKHVSLNSNNLSMIRPETFKGASSLETLVLSNNFELADMQSDTFAYNEFGNLSFIYILQTALVRIRVNSFKQHRKVGVVIAPTDSIFPFEVPEDNRLREGLARSGFTCNGTSCTPCPFGTYQRRLHNGSHSCIECPAGGFYQNTVGHYGTLAGQTGCLPCPKGTFVELDKFPGKHQYACRVCPGGSKTDEWASYRGCFCIDTFYRRGRFTQCEACPKGVRGYLCNETILVKEGYWWSFRDHNESWEYQRFVDALMTPDEKFNHADVNFTGIFPKPYPCPKAASCLGLLNSVRKPCKKGYGGPLCEVCVKGHYKSMSRCTKCPTLPWLITQMVFIVCAIFLLIFILFRDESKTKGKGRTLSDVVLARLKIVVGFYQVTAGTLDAFSYVQWPEALLQLSNYAKFVQLNLVQIAPIHCFKESLRMNAYVGLAVTVALNVGVIILAFTYFHFRKIMIRLNNDTSAGEKARAISLSKVRCYRSAFLVMFITFPEVSSRILRMLPPACHKICQDIDMKNCTHYLKMDYSLKCFDKTYNKYVTAAYVGSIYPVLFPLFIVVVLYFLYYRRHIKNSALNPQPKRFEIVEGMRFIYENYNERYWYWEIVDAIRKLILTSCLSLIGAEGRTYIGMAAMASGFYAVAHAQARPIPDKFEHLLQLSSLVATFFNLSVGVLLRIPSEMVNFSIEKDKDSVGVTVLLVTANVMVIGLVVVRYLYTLSWSLYNVHKNPQCNWECCVGVILLAHNTRANVTEEIGDQSMERNQVQGDDLEVRTIGGSVNDEEFTELGVENAGADDIFTDELQKETDKVYGRGILSASQTSGALRRPRRRTHHFPEHDPKCAETHYVKKAESSLETKETPQAFSVSSETPTRDPSVDVEVMIKEILGENMVEIHGPNRDKSSKKKPNILANVDADPERSNQAVDTSDDEETDF